MKMLALAFLILIGVMLVGEAFGQHVDKGYIYFAMAFSLGVELLNLRVRRKRAPMELRHSTLPEAIAASEQRGLGDGPPARVDLADDRLARHGAPVPAVGAAVAVVAHHDEVTGGDAIGAPVLVAAERALTYGSSSRRSLMNTRPA